ncbi:MAG: rod-binding protein, partial [Limnobacter sp.]|nr:rod-binding protein [Limnobacter sp.]
ARGLESLKNASRSGLGSEEYEKSIDETAKQFEALFLQWALKSMREASPEGGLFSDSATKSFQGMFDQELVQQISGKGLGLAGEIARQIRSQTANVMTPEQHSQFMENKPNEEKP